MSPDEGRDPLGRLDAHLAEVRATEDRALDEVRAWSSILAEVTQLRQRLEAKRVSLAEPFPGHDYVAHPTGFGGWCRKAVQCPDGVTRSCDEPRFSPIHDPQSYLAYARRMNVELGKFASWSGEYALEAGKPNPF